MRRWLSGLVIGTVAPVLAVGAGAIAQTKSVTSAPAFDKLSLGNQKVADYNQIVQEIARVDVENGVLLLGNAPVTRRMERPTKIVLGVAIPLATIFVIGLCCMPHK